MSKCEALLFGAGAVGAFFGGCLARNEDVNVCVVCRSDYDVVKRDGYDIKSNDGDFHFMPDAVFASAAEYDRKADYIIVSSKVLPEVDVPAMIRDAVSKDTSIMLIQNGIDIEREVAAAFPDNELISCIAYIGVTRMAHGKIVHTDGGTLGFGHYPEGVSPKIERLAELFRQVDIPAKARDDMGLARWEKLVWNVPFNPISVLTQANTAEIMAEPETELLARRVMEEVCAVAEASGWKLHDGIVEDQLEFTRNFRPYKPSMYVDYENNRPMEIEAIIGNVVRKAEKLSVPVPCIRSIYAMIKLLEK